MGCTASLPAEQEDRVIQNLDPVASTPSDINFVSSSSEYGTYKFKGVEAAKWMKNQGLSPTTLDDPQWQFDKAIADKVALAVMEWAKHKGASMVTHWAQPLGSAGVRRGQTLQVHNAMFNFGKKGELKWIFSGDELLKGETDGSSYMNGGLRCTHEAGGYTALDPSSPMFIRGDTLFIPTIFVSFYGKALDEKTPLLRSMEACSKAGVRLLGLLGYKCKKVEPMIGLEQEFFLVPRSAFFNRPDLQLAGRTIIGAMPARGQELSDHYMSALNVAAMACMKEMQHEAFKMGIPLKTRHREVAPNQYECAPYFGLASAQIDENLMVMELMEEIATKHGLACLLHEKPFKGINGSGKHNNFSLSTDTGLNLFNGPKMDQLTGSSETFAVIMSAVVKAIFENADLMRMAIAAPGNDFRLGAMEAPPSIISTYLGEALTKFLESVKNEKMVPGPYNPKETVVNPVAGFIAPFTVPAEDRNRTSPFPYGGHRFEFRACGSSQNVSMVNVVLCTAIADAFNTIADQIEGGKRPLDAASEALSTSWKIIFNGNGYSAEWQAEALKRELVCENSNVEAVEKALKSPKNVELFQKLGVFQPDELESRADSMHDQYVGMVEIELNCMVSMLKTKIIPAVKAAGLSTAALEGGVAKVSEVLKNIEAAPTPYAKAKISRAARMETLEEVRAVCDATEEEMPADKWPIATYHELLFLDFTEKASLV